jgi:four helix bundle protein
MAVKSFQDLEIHQIAEEVSDLIWEAVINWDSFAKYGLGKQITEAADSISFNIAEGFGRYSYKENRQFCYYARGSLAETLNGIMKSVRRKLISQELFKKLESLLNTLLGKLNRYIDAIGRNKS